MQTDFPRETVELQPFTVTVDGNPVTTGVQVSVVPSDTRPTAWTAPTLLGGRLGVMVDGMAPGIYSVWAKISSAPETPVLLVGAFRIT